MMDEKTKKTALRMIGYGVYVLGVDHEGDVDFATMTWLTQSSFKPPLIAVAIRKETRPNDLVRKSGRFAVSFLAKDQVELARIFAKPVDVEKESVQGAPFGRTDGGAPILVEAPAWIEAEVRSVDDRGDHSLVLAEVTDARIVHDAEPLSLAETGMNYGG